MDIRPARLDPSVILTNGAVHPVICIRFAVVTERLVVERNDIRCTIENERSGRRRPAFARPQRRRPREL
jgi:hypothetical protein